MDTTSRSIIAAICLRRMRTHRGGLDEFDGSTNLGSIDDLPTNNHRSARSQALVMTMWKPVN